MHMVSQSFAEPEIEHGILHDFPNSVCHLWEKRPEMNLAILHRVNPIGVCNKNPGRQCWSLPPTRTMLMFGLVKHRHSQCWCLTPVKKSADLGSAMKCKIIIHVFIIPTSPRVGALGSEFETHKQLQVVNFRTEHKSRNYSCKMS